ncbi:MAG TPA: type VI secretion system tube protein Hcp [Verrucomicrobiae bacterium]|nr:type VI secretion system tube protein Hcp [Verrucomicrobiae bacterium]
MPTDLPDVYLRFVGDPGEYTGESTDDMHPGEDGWITIRSFNFGFGFPGKDDSSGEEKPKTDKNTTNGQVKPTKKTKTEGGRSGPMTFDPISFSKSSDLMSISLMKACRDASKIKQVVLHACRAGGTDGDVKMVFIEITFDDVHLKSCKLNLTTEGLPSEDIEFTYEKVAMTSYWTDNATGGDRLKYGPLSVSWAMADADVGNQQASDD